LAQMGEMLSMIAHQWRQPLAAISSTASAVELKAVLGQTKNEELIHSVQNISEYVQHLSSTIDDFREFFKDNKSVVETSYQEIVGSVLNIVQIALESKGIEIEVSYGFDEHFKTFPNKLKQVVLNLVKNAEDVLLEKEIQKPKILIKTYKQDGEYILSVSDNATGITTDVLPFIFDPYFTTKEKKDGTGLGLYMSKTIIEEHCKGRLEVHNTQDGATFTIALKGN
jgi:two-component system, NtrC family, C4-dicarboxylate transport sensor histidine kinase DctB